MMRMFSIYLYVLQIVHDYTTGYYMFIAESYNKNLSLIF